MLWMEDAEGQADINSHDDYERQMSVRNMSTASALNELSAIVFLGPIQSSSPEKEEADEVVSALHLEIG